MMVKDWVFVVLFFVFLIFVGIKVNNGMNWLIKRLEAKK